MTSDTHQMTRRLLGAAKVLDPANRVDAGEGYEARAVFEQAYRDWIKAHQTVPGTPSERMERIRLLMMAMLVTSNLGDAIDIMFRFAKITLGDLAPSAIERRADILKINIARPIRPGPAGLIAELWPLSLYLSKLEFLAGTTLSGIYGLVRSKPSLPDGTIGLLFDRPLQHEAGMLALCIPAMHLKRAVIARPEQVDNFMPRLLPSTFERTNTGVELTTLVEAILRTGKLRGSLAHSSIEEVAERLGCSVATLRRRLSGEGMTFREIRARIFDELAKHWLHDPTMTATMIAERLGYSDAFSFQRSFTRVNGYSPSAYRRRLRRR